MGEMFIGVETKFCDYLRERCYSRLLAEEQLPDHGLPFRPPGWLAIAANRDNHRLRFPKDTWRAFITVIQEGRIDRKAYGLSSCGPITSSTDQPEEQPFVIPLTMDDIESHFGDPIRNWSSSIVVGPSERWVIWGTPDYTVLGGEPEIMRAVIDRLGGVERVIEETLKDFDIEEVREHREGLVSKKLFVRLIEGRES